MSRRRQVRRITVPAPARRTKAGGSMPSICIACGKDIDLDAVNVAIAEDTVYRHGCGRMLISQSLAVNP